MVSRGLGSARGTDDAAVAHDNNAVGYLENLSQAMRDEYDGDATLAEPTHAVEQALCLAIGQRRGRFVENQQPGILRQRTHDQDQLLNSARSRSPSGRVGSMSRANSASAALAWAPQRPVYQTEPLRFVVEEKPLLNRQVRRDVDLLR